MTNVQRKYEKGNNQVCMADVNTVSAVIPDPDPGSLDRLFKNDWMSHQLAARNNALLSIAVAGQGSCFFLKC